MTTLAPSPSGIAQRFPLEPPRSWFEELPVWFTPGDKLTVITEGPEAGRVAATVAPRDTCILDGGQDCWTAPFSPTSYGLAHQGDTITADGGTVRTANIGGGANHARLSASFSDAIDHYANTQSRTMRVRYYDLDSHIIALGALWPDLSDLDVAIVRASALSGDWRYRPEMGGFDMAGSQLVNNPGFPLIRAASASVYVGGLGGGVGVEDEPCEMCGQPADLAERVSAIERAIADVQDALAELANEGTVARITAAIDEAETRVASLTDRIEEVRTAALTGIERGSQIGDRIVDAVQAAVVGDERIPDALAKVAALEEAVTEVAEIAQRAAARPRRLVVTRDENNLITAIGEETDL